MQSSKIPPHLRGLRVLICGGRDYTDWETLCGWLDDFDCYRVTLQTVITGGAKGADALGFQWGCLRGKENLVFPADWDTHGKAAGPIRNQQMLDEGKPDLVVAFPTANSRGTWDMIRRAGKAGVETIVVPH